MHGGVRAACGRAPLDPAGSAIAALVFGDAATSANRSESACGPAVRRRDGRFRHERVRRGLAFIAEESAAVGAPHGPADLPIMLPAERAAHDPLGVQLGLHAPAERILALARLPHWQSGNDREIVEPRSTRRQNETEKGGAHRARARLQPPRGRRRRGIPPRRMRLPPRRRRLQAHRQALSAWRPQRLDQDEMPQPRRIRRRRLVRARRDRDPISVRSCSPITTTTGVFSMPAGSEPACRRRRSPRCSCVSPRSRSKPPRLPSSRRARRASAVASRCRASIGVRPVLVAEITYLTWADDGLLRHTVFVGLRDDKPPREVRRERPA